MTFRVVVDACVLYPFSLCDTLLRLAERELYDLHWSERILDELRRNLVERRLTIDQASWRLDQMRRTFPAAMVPAGAITRLEPFMTNHEKDRHVLAAAVAVRADGVVTFNVIDFPDASCAPHGVDVVDPDDFLVMLHDSTRLRSTRRSTSRFVPCGTHR